MKNTLVLLALLLVSSLAYAGPVEDVATGLSSLLFQEDDRYFDDRFDPYGGGPSEPQPFGGPEPFGGRGPYSDPFSAPSAGGPFGGGPFGAPQQQGGPYGQQPFGAQQPSGGQGFGPQQGFGFNDFAQGSGPSTGFNTPYLPPEFPTSISPEKILEGKIRNVIFSELDPLLIEELYPDEERAVDYLYSTVQESGILEICEQIELEIERCELGKDFCDQIGSEMNNFGPPPGEAPPEAMEIFENLSCDEEPDVSKLTEIMFGKIKEKMQQEQKFRDEQQCSFNWERQKDFLCNRSQDFGYNQGPFGGEDFDRRFEGQRDFPERPFNEGPKCTSENDLALREDKCRVRGKESFRVRGSDGCPFVECVESGSRPSGEIYREEQVAREPYSSPEPYNEQEPFYDRPQCQDIQPQFDSCRSSGGNPITYNSNGCDYFQGCEYPQQPVGQPVQEPIEQPPAEEPSGGEITTSALGNDLLVASLQEESVEPAPEPVVEPEPIVQEPESVPVEQEPVYDNVVQSEQPFYGDGFDRGFERPPFEPEHVEPFQPYGPEPFGGQYGGGQYGGGPSPGAYGGGPFGGPQGRGQSQDCDREKFIAQCIESSKKMSEKFFSEERIKKQIGFEMKRVAKEYQFFCKQAEFGQKQCVRHVERSCTFIDAQLKTCRTLTTEDKVREIVRRIVQNIFKWKKLQELKEEKGFESKILDAAEGLSEDSYYLEGDLSSVVSVTSSELVDAAATVEELNESERNKDILYHFTKVFGFQKENERGEANKLSKQIEKIEATIDALEVVVEQVDDDMLRRRISQVIDELEKEKSSLESVYDNKLSGAGGLFGGVSEEEVKSGEALVCETGRADCDGLSVNGCESSLERDYENCGACGIVCNENEACVNSVCTSI